MLDSWLRMLQDDGPPKSSWRPRKSTKSWDQFSVQKFTKVTQSRKKGPSRGKIGPTEPRGVEGMYQNSRCASKEKTWVHSTQKLNENWDAISLVFLSAVLGEFQQLPEHIAQFKRHIILINVWNWSLLWSKGKVQNSVRRSYHLNLCEAHRLNTWGQLPHLMNSGRKIQYFAENFVLLVVQGFIDSFFMLHLTYVSYIVIRRNMKNIMCPATIRSENTSEQAQGDLIQTQSQDDEQARGDLLPPELQLRKSVTGKEFKLISWNTEIAKCRRARHYASILNRGEVLQIAVAVDQSTVKICGNDENLPFKIKWDCWMAVRWMEEGTFA